MKRKVVMCICLCLIGTSLFGCGKKAEDNTVIVTEKTEEEETTFETAQVKRGKVVSEVNISCQYSPREKIECAFTGTKREIVEVLVEEGDLVTKGQVLARQDVDEYEDLLKEQEHELEMAKLQLTHIQEAQSFDLKLLDQEFGYVNEEDRDMAEYNSRKADLEREYGYDITDCNDRITVAEMRISEYRTKVEEGVLRAPVDGVVVLSRISSVGKVSDPKTSVVNLIKDGDLTFISNEVEKAEYLQDGEIYEVLVGKGETQKRIEVTPTDRDQWEENIYFEILMPDLNLEKGVKAELWIQLDEKDNVLYVPNEAVYQMEDKYYVYTITNEGLRNIQYVTIGLQGRAVTEIKDGLTEGQYVIIN